MNEIYENIEESNPNKKRKRFIVLDDIIAHMLNNKKRIQIVTELYIRGSKLDIFLFLSHSLTLLY